MDVRVPKLPMMLAVRYPLLSFAVGTPEPYASNIFVRRGFGGKAVFAKSCVCVRNRSQPSATVCVRSPRLCHARLLGVVATV